MNLRDNKRVPGSVWREEREEEKWYNYTVISKKIRNLQKIVQCLYKIQSSILAVGPSICDVNFHCQLD